MAEADHDFFISPLDDPVAVLQHPVEGSESGGASSGGEFQEPPSAHAHMCVTEALAACKEAEE